MCWLGYRGGERQWRRVWRPLCWPGPSWLSARVVVGGDLDGILAMLVDVHYLVNLGAAVEFLRVDGTCELSWAFLGQDLYARLYVWVNWRFLTDGPLGVIIYWGLVEAFVLWIGVCGVDYVFGLVEAFMLSDSAGGVDLAGSGGASWRLGRRLAAVGWALGSRTSAAAAWAARGPALLSLAAGCGGQPAQSAGKAHSLSRGVRISDCLQPSRLIWIPIDLHEFADTL